MHNPGNGLSAYWMQGKIERRVDKYTVAKESGFTRNRFKVKNLSVINHWGEDLGTTPETLIINLSRSTAWALGRMVELGTSEEEQAIMLEESDVYGASDDDDNEADKAIARK